MTSRRDFIKKTTASTAAVTLGGLVLPNYTFASILGANEQINCAVIGVRSRAKAHVMAIHRAPNAKVLYNCDVDDTIIGRTQYVVPKEHWVCTDGRKRFPKDFRR